MRREGMPQSHRVRITELSEHESFNALMKQTAIEVYQETGFDAAEPQVSQELRLEQWVHAFHALQLQDHRVLYNEVQP
jgi:hypothetical protein